MKYQVNFRMKDDKVIDGAILDTIPSPTWLEASKDIIGAKDYEITGIPEELNLTWKDVMNFKVLIGFHERRKLATQVGYKYFIYNDGVYHVDTEYVDYRECWVEDIK